MLHETAIKKALREAPQSGKKTIELKDDGGRGEGRLALILRVRGEDVTAEWYAVWYDRGRRAMAKIGPYPALSLADARKDFKADFLPAIARGETPKKKRERREAGSTLLDLFVAYVAHLEAKGCRIRELGCVLLGADDPAKRWPNAKVENAARGIGKTLQASKVLPKDITPYLSRIHARGAVSAAAHARNYIQAAFAFAMESANAYHRPAGAVDWGVVVNPVAAIPSDSDAKKAGERNLTPAEVRDFWTWLADRRDRSAAALALQLAILLGQRPGEMLRLTPNPETAAAWAETHPRCDGALGVHDGAEKTIFWGWTKNGRAHLLPLPDLAVDVLTTCGVSRNGLYFPRAAGKLAGKSVMTVCALEQLCNEYLNKRPGMARFTPRDLRRTWKTLTGAAGLAKDIRDRLQNHSEGDVSSKHYDRYSYLAEKRAAMKVWNAYFERILSGDLDNPVAELPRAAV